MRGFSGRIPVTLKTNAEGFVRLYELENVLSVQSSVEPQGDISADPKVWIIKNAN